MKNITCSIPEESYATIEQLAQHRGEAVEEVVRDVVNEGLEVVTLQDSPDISAMLRYRTVGLTGIRAAYPGLPLNILFAVLNAHDATECTSAKFDEQYRYVKQIRYAIARVSKRAKGDVRGLSEAQASLDGTALLSETDVANAEEMAKRFATENPNAFGRVVRALVDGFAHAAALASWLKS